MPTQFDTNFIQVLLIRPKKNEVIIYSLVMTKLWQSSSNYDNQVTYIKSNVGDGYKKDDPQKLSRY